MDARQLAVVDRSIRVVLADDSGPLRALLRRHLDDQAGIEVVGEARDGAEAVAVIDTLRPDVVLLDIAMPSTGGLEALRMRLPSLPMVMLSGFSAERLSSRAGGLGAVAYGEKTGDLHAVSAAVRAAAASVVPAVTSMVTATDPADRAPHPGGDARVDTRSDPGHATADAAQGSIARGARPAPRRLRPIAESLAGHPRRLTPSWSWRRSWRRPWRGPPAGG